MSKRLILLFISVAFFLALRATNSPQFDPVQSVHSVSRSNVVPVVLTPSTSSRHSFISVGDGGFTVTVPALSEPSRVHDLSKPVVPTFPRSFAEPVQVRSERANVQATPVGGNSKSTPRVDADGSLVYADAFPGCDVKYRCETSKTEEFIVVREAGANEWSWDLDTCGLELRLTPAHTVELVDPDGVPRLRIDAPFGFDAKGFPLRAGERLAMTLNGARLTLHADLTDCAYPVTIDPSWSSTGLRNSISIGQFADVTLPDGRILVTGGAFSSTVVADCEIFDPVSGTWSVAAPLPGPRQFHAAILLTDGRVLVFGGSDGVTVPDTYYISDPAVTSWSSTSGSPTINIATAARVAGGKVVVSGGGSSQSTNVFLYDPDEDEWTSTGSFNTARAEPVMISLLDGTALAIGGVRSASTTTCEVYDPETEMWTPVGSLNVTRVYNNGNGTGDYIQRLVDGRVIAAGSFKPTIPDAGRTAACEIYDPASKSWTLVAPLLQPREFHSIGVLANGLVVASGGTATTPFGEGLSEVYNPGTNTWIAGPKMPFRQQHRSCALPNNKLLVFGGGAVEGSRTCDIFDPSPSALSASFTLEKGPLPVVLASDTILPVQSYTVSSPSHGTLTGTPPALSYSPDPAFVGTDMFTFRVTDGIGLSNTATVTLIVSPSPPTVTSGPFAAPNPAEPGESIQFVCAASDDQTFTVTWDFGDGVSAAGTNPTHTYAAAGAYTATLTVTDAAGTATVRPLPIQVSRKPKARFTTSDVVGFVGLPLAFDAVFSTDPENALTEYRWNFGDGSPTGVGPQISVSYAAPGSYPVTLTVIDAAGQTDAVTRVIEILDAGQIGTFNSEIAFKATLDFAKPGTDSLVFNATVNVGDVIVGQSTSLALTVSGTTFQGLLDGKLSDKRDKNAVWKLKANTRRQAAGEVELSLKVKKATLAAGFAAAGVVAGTNPREDIALALPLTLTIGDRVFDVVLDSEFSFSKGGAKAKGGAEGD